MYAIRSYYEELLVYLKNNITFTKDYLKKSNSKITFREPEVV